MSRSGYVDDWDFENGNWQMIRWRGAVKAALRGARGQAFLRETLEALEALPEPKLAANSLETAEGDYCLLGAVGRARGMNMADLDPDNHEAVSAAFDIADAMAREIVYENDECGGYGETPRQRWSRMWWWVKSQIKADTLSRPHPMKETG